MADHARESLGEWGHGERVEVEAIDVRRYASDEPFDLVTLHNLVYYFPLAERVDMLRRLAGFLRPGGRLVLTSLCRGGDPATCTMDLWSVMTEGSGPLPESAQLTEQLREAGFVDVETASLLPTYLLFTARTAAC